MTRDANPVMIAAEAARMRGKIPGFAKRIEELKEALGIKTQAEFGDKLKVSQSTMSAWLRGDKKRPPSAEAYFRLARLAPDPDKAIWFLQQTGLDVKSVLLVANKLSKYGDALPVEGDIVRIRRFRFTEKGREEAGPPVPLPAEFILNERTTICLLVDEKATGVANSPRGLFIIDTSVEGAEDLSALWNHVIMLRYPGTPYLQEGVYVGRLHLQDEASNAREPERARAIGRLAPLTGHGEESQVVEYPYLGGHVEREAMRGIALDDKQARQLKMDEIRERARSEFRLDKGVRILGKVIGRLTGHLERSEQGKR
jgi:transcriptional regulator with XRE-family HTH domain